MIQLYTHSPVDLSTARVPDEEKSALPRWTDLQPFQVGASGGVNVLAVICCKSRVGMGAAIGVGPRG